MMNPCSNKENRKAVMKRPAVLFFAVLCIVLWAGSFCPSSAAAPQAGGLYKNKITIGTAIWPGYLGLYVAKEKGYFKEAGLDVDIVRSIGLAELSKDYVAGKMQGRANLVFDAVKEYFGGFDHKVVLAIDYSNGSDAILARKEILSIGDLKGKRVAYEFGTLEEFFLAWALAENTLKLSDIVPVNANPEEAAKMLLEGQVDVAVTYEPFASKVVSADGFHAIVSSADYPGLITDILTFRSDFIEAYPETVRAIINAYYKGLDFWKAHPAEAHAIVARYLDDTPEGIAGQLKGVKILDRHDNENAFTFSTGLQSLYGNMRKIARYIRQHGDIARSIAETDQLVDKNFVKQSDDQPGL
jgi:NitT/TauT family transport system substrate-binding protein